ncbi:hypothetical protein KFK09_021912 [Dendrobium nobile]|uniref:Uncharacterized protein n=1 Tax=Dendrobium nobile TaxID=94219 RepID=A0A8T3AHK7_DENNO|nr:hypothetical protein KFK09_021912 [Dendrobium nobile]
MIHRAPMKSMRRRTRLTSFISTLLATNWDFSTAKWLASLSFQLWLSRPSKCPVTGKRIIGFPRLRPAEYKRSRLQRNRRTVHHAYGGVLSVPSW